MPAYFNITTEFDKELGTEGLVRNFYDVLAGYGVTFLCGDRKSKGFSFDKQIAINQNYINNCNLKEGGFYQAQFRFLDYSEVRGYWTCSDKRILFELIIPEDDFYGYTETGIVEHEDRMNTIKELFVNIWGMPNIKLIQTSWECSAIPPKYEEINAKCMPQTEPFSIVSKLKYHDSWNVQSKDISRDGVLLENKDNWFYT